MFAAIREYDRRTLKDVPREFDAHPSAIEAALAEMDVEEPAQMSY